MAIREKNNKQAEGEKKDIFLRMGAGESKFADIIWENEPISSSDLSRRSEELLGWKKTTSFTVLKRLCDKGLFRNIKGTVTSMISKKDYYSARSEEFVEENFGGSLPAFLTLFASRKPLTADEVKELKKLIEEYEK